MSAEAYRLSIGPSSPDTAVQQVLDVIDNEVLVADALGRDGVQGVLEGWSRRANRAWSAYSLDLVAHARRGVVQLGDWSVDGGDKAALLRQCMQNLPGVTLSEIRLLGCNTAVTEGGQAAMRALADVFGVPVKGTLVPISSADFSPAGFSATAVLAVHNRLPQLRRPTLADAGAWLGRFERLSASSSELKLRRESLSDAIRDWTHTRPQLRWPIRQLAQSELAEVLAHAEPGVFAAPGLLALPDVELVVPVESDLGMLRFHRITVLLDGLFLRVYPRDLPEGVVMTAHEGLVADVMRRGLELLRP
jgi:hypothetical protein